MQLISESCNLRLIIKQKVDMLVNCYPTWDWSQTYSTRFSSNAFQRSLSILSDPLMNSRYGAESGKAKHYKPEEIIDPVQAIPKSLKQLNKFVLRTAILGDSKAQLQLQRKLSRQTSTSRNRNYSLNSNSLMTPSIEDLNLLKNLKDHSEEQLRDARQTLRQIHDVESRMYPNRIIKSNVIALVSSSTAHPNKTKITSFSNNIDKNKRYHKLFQAADGHQSSQETENDQSQANLAENMESEIV